MVHVKKTDLIEINLLLKLIKDEIAKCNNGHEAVNLIIEEAHQILRRYV